jgi:membrane protein implicated in regulation of membrane protease activity
MWSLAQAPPMTTTRRRRFQTAQLAWMLASCLLLVALDALTLELFFVVSLIGFLVVIELTAPFNVTPAWRRRLRWVVALGLVVFAYIVVRRILEILPPGVI